MKRCISFILVIVLTTMLFLTACSSKESTSATSAKDAETLTNGGVSSGYPEYLNLDGPYPVIKDEFKGKIKLKLALVQDSNSGKWEDLWISRYLRDKYNMEFEVETIFTSAISERKSLMFSSGDLPDIMINMGLSANEIMKYGQTEGQLLKCDEYINETLTRKCAV